MESIEEADCGVKDIRLDPNDWEYKNEGACNIILTYKGDLSSELHGNVLRLKKTGGSKATHAGHDHELHEYKFMKKTLAPLIGQSYVHPGVIVRVTKEFLEQMNQIVKPHRPDHRLSAVIDEKAPYAFLLPDITLFPNFIRASPSVTQPHPHHVFCVEIKPKWGFLPQSRYIHPDNQVKYTTCRYCMHQYSKVKDGSVKHLSGYCPLDLYSSETSRLCNALNALVEHPQNNLKVYCDAELCFTGSLGGRKKTDADFDLAHLTRKLTDSFPKSGDKIGALIELIKQILQTEPVLQNLRKIQMQDDIDIEAIHYLYNKLNNQNVSNTADNTRFVDLDTLSEEEIRQKISIICATTVYLQYHSDIELNNKESYHFSVTYSKHEGIDFQYRIGVVDLDQRMPTLIPQYFELDQKIVKIYSAAELHTKKKCVM